MNISDLISRLSTIVTSPGLVPEIERAELIAACENVKRSLETPVETLFRWLFAPHQAIALRLAVDMQLFDAAAEASSMGKDVSLEQLAFKSCAELLFVRRIMRVLVAMQVFREESPSTYSMAPLAAALVTGSPLPELVVHVTTPMEVLSRLPVYFATTGYKSPNDAFHGPFQYARQTNLHCFDWLAAHPRLQSAFNVVMASMQSHRGAQWYTYFPVEEKLSGFDPSQALIVDVGGGVGHDLITFKEQYPNLEGRLVVQDISVVIEGINSLPHGIESMSHDFFTPQPVKNARAYFLTNVLHDWPDKQAHEILKSIACAMGQGSIVLVNENVLPERKVSLISAMTDMNMMANFSALERTLKHLTDLLEQAGLQLVKAWTPLDSETGGRMSLEAVLKA